MNSNTQSEYRWYMLGLSASTVVFALAMPQMAMPVLFKEIADELQLNLVQIGAVWGMAALSGAFIMPLGGMLGDRFGVKRVVIIMCLTGGIVGALRGVSGDLLSLVVTVFLTGILTAALPIVIVKGIGGWFQGKELVFANAVVSMAMGIGFTLGAIVSATFLSPLLHGWRNVLFFYGFISVVLCILWTITGREAGHDSATASSLQVSFRQAIARVIRIKNLWLLSLNQFGFGGCFFGVIGYLPLYFRGAGWMPALADGTVTVLNLVSSIFSIPIAMLSIRLGIRRGLLLVTLVITMVSVALLSVASDAMVWPLVIGAGIFRDAFMAVLMTMIIEMALVGPAYSGTAMGLVIAFQRLGAFISPPLGNSLASINPRLPFLVWAGFALFAFIVLLFLRKPKGIISTETVR